MRTLARVGQAVQHERRQPNRQQNYRRRSGVPHYWHVDIVGGDLIMAYVIAGEIVFDDLPEYPECENTLEANHVAYERDIWDGLTTQELIDLDLPF